MFGFHFPENFNHPYRAGSVTEFWRRWHMTLSRWFRDYLYIPLGGGHKGSVRTYVNLFVVFLLCGLWHGASWTFAFWGLYHGVLLVIERLIKDHGGYQPSGLAGTAYTFVVVTIGWVFFRSDNIGFGFRYLGLLFGQGAAAASASVYPLRFYLQNDTITYLIIAAFLSFVPYERLLAGADQASSGARVAQGTGAMALVLLRQLLPLDERLQSLHLFQVLGEGNRANPTDRSGDLRDFAERFEDFFNDRYGFRDLFIRTKNQIDYTLFGKSEKIFIGKEGFLFYRVVEDQLAQADRRSPEEEATIRENVRAFVTLAQGRGLTPIFMPMPLESTIYPEMLPDDAPRRKSPSSFDEHVAFLKTLPAALVIDRRRRCGAGRPAAGASSRRPTSIGMTPLGRPSPSNWSTSSASTPATASRGTGAFCV